MFEIKITYRDGKKITWKTNVEQISELLKDKEITKMIIKKVER